MTMRKTEEESEERKVRWLYGRAFPIVKISAIPDLLVAARFNYVCHFIAGVSL